MKTLKKVSLIVLLTIVIMLLTVFLLVKTGNTASAINKNKEPLPEVEYIINGETVTGNVTVERGTYISVVVKYDGEKYIPELFTATDSFAYQIIGNELSILPDSRIGGEMLLHAVIIKDGIEIILDPIAIVPVWESNFGEKIINESNVDGYSITFVDENIISVKTSISMQNGGKTAKVLSKGDGIEDVINISKHGYAGLTLDFEEITVNTVDNFGNFSAQTVTNGLDNLLVSAYATRGLNGSGTQTNPYLISSKADLELIPSYDGASKYFRQTTDITLYSSTSSHGEDFYGKYYGNDKYIIIDGVSCANTVFCYDLYGEIDHLRFYVYDLTLSGLSTSIVCVHNYGVMKNIMVECYIDSTSGTLEDRIMGLYCAVQVGTLSSFGGLATFNTSSGTIYNTFVSINIRCNCITGGIAAINQDGGAIYNCYMDFYVYGMILTQLSRVGGVVATNNNGGYVYYNSIGELFVIFNNQSASTAVPRVGGIIGSNLSPSSRVFVNELRYGGNVMAEGYPTILSDAQRVYINTIYGYGAV